jgi:moderate conductance mechanosensitive channel
VTPPRISPTQITDIDLLGACGEEPSWICRWVLENSESEFLATTAEFMLARPARILLIIVLAWVVNRLVRRAIRKFAARVANPDVATLGAISKFRPAMLATTNEVNLRAASRAETLSSVLRSSATVVIWGFALLMILGEFEINLGPLIAGAGIAGVALGFGAQSLVKDFLTGIFMLIEDQYGVGDIIDVGEAVGEVEAVTLRTTKLRGLDGSAWHVPNGEIARVGNLSQEWSRALLDIEVAYSTDLTKAREVIMAVAQGVHEDPDWAPVILAPPEIWGVESLGADGIAIRLVVATKPGMQWGLQRELRGRIKDTFDAEGIEIPFPQRAVWFRNDLAELAARSDVVPPPAPVLGARPTDGDGTPEVSDPDLHRAKGDRAESDATSGDGDGDGGEGE